MEEIDSVSRHINDYSNNSDTTYLIKNCDTIQFDENKDSLHTITCDSYFPPFTFPIKFEYYTSNAIYRFGGDSLYRQNCDAYIMGGTTWSFKDSLLFQHDKGLVYAVSVTNKGPNTPYYYRWEATLISAVVTSVKNDLKEVPKNCLLSQNYPNPFNPTTQIDYQLAATSNVSLKVFDILGREVTLLVNRKQTAGSHQATFNAKTLPSGIYFYRLQTGSYTETKKMLLLK
jgi:hypothetical protein